MRGLFRSPNIPPDLSMRECGATGSASCRTACPVCPTIRHISGSGRSNAIPRPGRPSAPLLLVWTNVSSLPPWLSDFPAVQFLSLLVVVFLIVVVLLLVVRGGTVCLPTPPSWFSLTVESLGVTT